MRHIIIGLTINDAQGYAMRQRHEHKGHDVQLVSTQHALQGGLLGYAAGTTEVTVLPSAWRHRDAVTFGQMIHHLELQGIKVITLPNEGDTNQPTQGESF